jgi:type II secretory pathway pseudopilin PulG
MLAVIVIIGLLATLATPSFIAMMRDRRVTQVGVMMADTYREARTRSLARGLAVAVRWQSDGNGKGTLEIREAIMLLPGLGKPAVCHTADWSTASADTRRVSVHNYASSIYELAGIKLVTEGGVDTPFGEMCFAPEGRTYVRYSDNGVFTALTGVPHFEIINTSTQLKRTVYLPPNGVARLAL